MSKKTGFFWHFFSILKIFEVCAFLGQSWRKSSTVLFVKKKNLIFWHPWDPQERVHIDLNKNSVQTGCVHMVLWWKPYNKEHLNNFAVNQNISYYQVWLYLSFHKRYICTYHCTTNFPRLSVKIKVSYVKIKSSLRSNFTPLCTAISLPSGTLYTKRSP